MQPCTAVPGSLKKGCYLSSTTSNKMDIKEATLEKEQYSLHQCVVMIATAVCFASVCIGVWMRETTPAPLLYSDGQVRDRDIQILVVDNSRELWDCFGKPLLTACSGDCFFDPFVFFRLL